MASDKELKDQDWDSYEMKEASFDGVKLLAIKWIDNRSVTMLSSFLLSQWKLLTLLGLWGADSTPHIKLF